MRIRDAMTPSPASCEPGTSIRTVAQLMIKLDCAAIPVTASGRVIGIVTDRDIACRAVVQHPNAAELPVSACMSQPVIAVTPDEPVENAIELMEENAIQHLPVIGPDGTLLGIIALSDLGRRMTNREFGALARMTSIRSRYPRRSSSALVVKSH
jgi:CBS domain-containing protein